MTHQTADSTEDVDEEEISVKGGVAVAVTNEGAVVGPSS